MLNVKNLFRTVNLMALVARLIFSATSNAHKHGASPEKREQNRAKFVEFLVSKGMEKSQAEQVAGWIKEYRDLHKKKWMNKFKGRKSPNAPAGEKPPSPGSADEVESPSGSPPTAKPGKGMGGSEEPNEPSELPTDDGVKVEEGK